MKQQLINKLKELTKHNHIEIVLRGNSAILSALHLVKKKLLIPEEGGWLSYEKFPKKLGIDSEKVKCDNAIIDLEDLKQKVKTADVFLYQNPGGYHAEQPMKEIHQICQENDCLVVLDVSGAIGTELCDGDYADVMLSSFGRWKLVEAKGGGFISCKEEFVFNQIKDTFEILEDKEQLKTINEKINDLSNRIKFLTESRNKVLNDLNNYKIINKDNLGFVVIIEFDTENEKDKITTYCNDNNLEYTECPRYIRINKKAISIEIKKL
jgi:glycine/serine hydroxymethyltransferase